jgi:hypothetical protein
MAQERILVPANGQAAWRASWKYASLTLSPQSFESAVSATAPGGVVQFFSYAEEFWESRAAG